MKKTVEELLEEIRSASSIRHTIVQHVRTLVKKSLKSIEEEVKYGGILFSSEGVQFGGVFSYTHHVTFEFGMGASIEDPYGFLEGKGKGRRHLKLRTPDDIDDLKLKEYLKLGLKAARVD